MGVPKFPQLGFSQLWGSITLRADLWLKWGLKKSCSPCRDLSNGMSHATWKWGNMGDSRLLVVGSQIGNLTPDPSFGHNLCLKCPNGSCEGLYIYVPNSNDIRNSLIHWGLTPTIAFWKFGSPSGLQLLKWKLPWECEGSQEHEGSREHEVWLPSFPLGLQPCKPLLWSRAQG